MSSTRAPASLRRVATCLALAATMLVPMVGTASAAAPSANKPCKKPSGEPVKVSMITNFEGPVIGKQNFLGGARASVKSVNCAGGIQGRPMELLACNGNPFQDPNLGPNCARDAIAKGVVASTAMLTLDAAVVQAFDDVGIPMVGAPVSLRGFTVPHSFPITAGIPGGLAGQAAKLYDEGYRRIRVMVTDTPMSAAIAGIANLGLKARGAEVLPPVLVPGDPSADDSAIIQSAIQGADAIIMTTAEDSTKKVAPELRAAGFKGPISASVTILAPDIPETKDFQFVGSTYPASSTDKPGIDRYNADMDRFSPNDKYRDLEGDIIAWESVQIVADALQKVPTISAASLYTALQTYTVSFGVAPDVNFGNGGNAYGISRIFTPFVVGQRIKNKQYVLDGEFFDPTKAPTTTTTTKPKK